MPEEGIQGIVARATLGLSLGNFKTVTKSNNNNHNKRSQNFPFSPYLRVDDYDFPESLKFEFSPHLEEEINTPLFIYFTDTKTTK